MLGDRNFLLKAWVSTVVFMSLIAPGLSPTVKAQTESAIRNEFRTPPKQFRPMVRWWWPGGDVTDQEIEREISILDSHGFGGAEIQPFNIFVFTPGLLSKQEMERVNDFATPTFFKHVRVAADAAKAHGMWIDDTFGTGWPFGGGLAITPELSSIDLRFTDNIVFGPQKYSGKLAIPEFHPDPIAGLLKKVGAEPIWPKGWEERFEARSKIVAVVAMREDSSQTPSAHNPTVLDRTSTVVLTDRMQPDGSLDWEVPEGKWHIFVFRQFPTREPVGGSAGTGPQLVLDHLNKAAFEAHAARVGNPLTTALAPDVGTSLRAIFCDSLEVDEYLWWTDDFLQQFKKRRGYDLTPYLAILRHAGDNYSPPGPPMFNVTGGDTIRADYSKTVSELIVEGFYHPFDEWARQHKLLSRVQAHGAPGDLLKLYGDASIPETEQLAGGNTVNFMKLASSAGYDYGRRIVSSESFIVQADPYGATPEFFKVNTDKLLIAGINQIIYHGFPYKFDAGPKGIGWYPFSRYTSQMNEVNPFWPFIGKVNTYITRLQYITQTGSSDLQVAIFRSSLGQDDTGPPLASGPVHDPFPAIEKALTSAGLSFGFVNEDALLDAGARDKGFSTRGGGHYRALVIPLETNVSPELVKKLESFANARVPIVFVGGSPGVNASFITLQQDREQVTGGLTAINRASGSETSANATDATSRLIALIPPQVSFVSGNVLPFLKKTIGTTRFYLLTNPNAGSARAVVEFNESAVPQVWDPWTGEVHGTTFSRKNGHVSLSLALPAFGSELIAFNNESQRLPVPAQWTELKRENIGTRGWSVDAVGDLEQGVGVHVHLDMAKLKDWLNVPELRTFSGTATYTTHVSVSQEELKHAGRVVLDLGDVKNAADVKVNGVDAGQIVIEPFSLDIRPLLHPGDNFLAITVANSLTNYVSTVEFPKSQLGAHPHYSPVSSGLLGPVVLEYEESVPAVNSLKHTCCASLIRRKASSLRAHEEAEAPNRNPT